MRKLSKTQTRLLPQLSAYLNSLTRSQTLPTASRAASRKTYDKAYTRRKTLLVKKFVCLRQRGSRILRGRSRAERPQDSAGMKKQPTGQRRDGHKIGNRVRKE